jgi:hypothetical protein
MVRLMYRCNKSGDSRPRPVSISETSETARLARLPLSRDCSGSSRDSGD